MTGIVHRVGGSPLTNAQIDANFDYLDTSITPVGNVAYDILPTDRIVITTSTLTADRIWKLPSAASVAAGRSIVIIDVAGGVSANFSIYAKVEVGEKFNNQLNNFILIRVPYDRVIFTSNGVDNWSGGVHINGQSQTEVAAALGLHELAWRDDAEVLRLGANNAGDIYLSGDGRRIGGPMSDSVHSKRMLVQNTVGDAATNFGVIPNGTSTTSDFRSYSKSDPDAAQASSFFGQVGDDTVLRAAPINSGTQTPRIRLQVGSGAQDVIIADATGAQLGTPNLATTATSGFAYIPSCAGTPTGVPTAVTGMVPQIWDRTNKKWYVYDGSWLPMN